MIIKSTTHSTRITAEPGSTYADAPRETTFLLNGRERTMALDGRLEDSVVERMSSPSLTDVRQLAAVLRNPSVARAQELLGGGAQSVAVDLGALGAWEAREEKGGTVLQQAHGETTVHLRGRYVTLDAFLPADRTMQAITGRYNESTGTITTLGEEVRTTEVDSR